MAATRPLILVTHPGRQHSHQAALGLAKAGSLAGYWSGVPSLERHRRRVPHRLWNRYATLSLPPELVRCAPWVPALRRIGGRLPRSLALRVDFAACRLFDRWVAAGLEPGRHDAVIACEISALTTFRRARRLGIATVLDAPSIHHREQDRVQRTLDPPALHRHIAAVKDAEVALADAILTVSALARDSYIVHGTPPERVHSLVLGADGHLFGAHCEQKVAGEGTTFLFAGAAIRRKGLDVLLDAFGAVHGEHPATRLRVVGSDGDASSLLEGVPGVEQVGSLDQRGLARELAAAHCLVLPSRHDSFGMVVVESLASGTPVIVSDMVGAKDLVTPASGWIVPTGNVQALTDRLRWCATHPADLLAMAPACRDAAAAATWEAYHRRLATLLGEQLTRHAPPQGRDQPSGLPA